MLSILKYAILFVLLVSIAFLCIEARPQNSMESIQALDTLEADTDEMQNLYYDLPLQQQQQQQHHNFYPSIPLDRLQMYIARYNRPTAYFRSPSAAAGMNELYRLPESKRQVRYRQCYFNPISCFKK